MSYDDDDDDDEGSSEEEDEDLVALRSALDVSHRSSDGARLSSVDHQASVVTEEGSAQKQAASSPLRGMSLKCPCAATDGCD